MRLLPKLLLFLPTISAVENPLDQYCGTTWPDAFESCPLACPGGEDGECSSLGETYRCFGYTGCNAKLGGGQAEAEGETVVEDGVVEEEVADEGGNVVDQNKYCGSSW
jgi:hypothetical protein